MSYTRRIVRIICIGTGSSQIKTRSHDTSSGNMLIPGIPSHILVKRSGRTSGSVSLPDKDGSGTGTYEHSGDFLKHYDDGPGDVTDSAVAEYALLRAATSLVV
jgi:hypothetical protein